VSFAVLDITFREGVDGILPGHQFVPLQLLLKNGDLLSV
jgi:hypothetical protein